MRHSHRDSGITKATTFVELSQNAQNYSRHISELVGVKNSTLPVEPDRNQTIILSGVFR